MKIKIIFLSITVFLQRDYHQEKLTIKKPNYLKNSPKILVMPFSITLFSYLGWFGLARGFTILFPNFQVYLGEIHLQHYFLGLIFLYR